MTPCGGSFSRTCNIAIGIGVNGVLQIVIAVILVPDEVVGTPEEIIRKIKRFKRRRHVGKRNRGIPVKVHRETEPVPKATLKKGLRKAKGFINDQRPARDKMIIHARLTASVILSEIIPEKAEGNEEIMHPCVNFVVKRANGGLKADDHLMFKMPSITRDALSMKYRY
jgi:hypothetical protein